MAVKGNILWRGGESIKVKKEKELFTALIKSPEEEALLDGLKEVDRKELIQHGIYKVFVKKYKGKRQVDARDAAMSAFRDERSTDTGERGICHHAYIPTGSGSNRSRYYLTDRIIVQFSEGLTIREVEEIIEERKTILLKEYPGFHRTFLLQITDESKHNPIKVAHLYAEKYRKKKKSNRRIEFVEPNLINRYQTFYRPTDHYFPHQWHLESRTDVHIRPEASVFATSAWEITRGDRNTVVAVIDDGFDLNHPDFTGNGKIVAPIDLVDGDASPFPEGNNFHGTPCAGVAVAEENGVGVVGIAPECALLPIRFDLRADDNTLHEIFEYAGLFADVISCSWGPPPVDAPLSELMYQTFERLSQTGGPRGKGCVIVFAAGNDNAPIFDPDNERFQYWDENGVLREHQGRILNGEAAHPNVVTVAASTSLIQKAVYSNWGAEVDLCAPSNNFHPAPGMGPIPGRGVWTTNNGGIGGDTQLGLSLVTSNIGGTSIATPLVAGIAALVLAVNPDLSATQVKEILTETADKIEDPNANLTLLQFPNVDPNIQQRGVYDENGHSDWFGFGKVNATRAVMRALELQRQADDEN